MIKYIASVTIVLLLFAYISVSEQTIITAETKTV